VILLLFILLSVACFQLHGSSLSDRAIFEESIYTGRFFPRSGFQEIASTRIGVSEENLTCYLREDAGTRKTEILAVWNTLGKGGRVGTLTGSGITGNDLRKLLHAACVDPESEKGLGLIDDIYSKVFALSDISFSFGKNNKNAIDKLSRRVKVADHREWKFYK
jgi:hypothetical protein